MFDSSPSQKEISVAFKEILAHLRTAVTKKCFAFLKTIKILTLYLNISVQLEPFLKFKNSEFDVSIRETCNSIDMFNDFNDIANKIVIILFLFD